MQRTWKTRALCLLLMVCLLLGTTPMPTFAEDATGSAGTAAPEVTYSSDTGAGFEDPAPVYHESDGSRELILSREDNVPEALTVTVQIYDNSANYGQDYVLKYGGTTIEKIEGSISVYDAFRDDGTLTSDLPVDAAECYVTYSGSPDAQTQISAADMLAQLQSVGALAAQFSVTFAAGEATVPLAVEILGDDLSEYDETFMVVLLGGDQEVIKGSQILCSIIDDEADPTVHVEFDCESSLEADESSNMAQITFKRTGDLATGTTAVLLYDGEPMGYVDFAPHQDTQVVLALPGSYTLFSDGDYTVDDQTVTVEAQPQVLPEGADPELDAVPDQYDALPTMIQGVKDNDWFPSWAKNRTSKYEDDSCIIVMGSDGLFSKSSSSTEGLVTFYSDKNMYLLSTEDGPSSGIVYLRTNSAYNLAGIESIEGSMYVNGMHTGYGDVILGVTGLSQHKIYNFDNNSRQDLKYTLPDNCTDSSYIYYANRDLDKIANQGWEGYVPNGFKMNKRTYYVYVEEPNTLNYNDGVNRSSQLTSTREYYITVGSDNYINITLSTDTTYRSKLVGYKLKNLATGQTSGLISLSGGRITFDQSFLKNHEASWCYDATAPDGKSYNTFVICPVIEKVPVYYEILPSTMGTFSISSPANGNLYKGDTVTFSATSNDGTSFSGVRVVKRAEKNGAILSVSVEKVLNGSLSMILADPENKYGFYSFQPLFGTDHDHLYVNYAEPNSSLRHGTLERTEGLMLSGEDYRVNDYFTLLADADDGYVTVWTAGDKTFYGDAFYFQLEGDENRNNITVDFVSESSLSVTNGSIIGTVLRVDRNYLTGAESKIALSGASISITGSSGTYTTKADGDGNFIIENFRGVPGGTYSVAISANNRISYMEITYTPGGSHEIVMPQFASNEFRPASFAVGGTGVSINSNFISLSETNPVQIAVDVYVPSDEYTITGVKLHFVPTVGTEGLVTDAVRTEALNPADRCETWTLDAYANEIPSGTHLYVSVTAERTYTYQDSTGSHTATTLMTTDLVNTGWDVTLRQDVTNAPIPVDVPDIPGIGSTATFNGGSGAVETTALRASAASTDPSSTIPEIPIIGTLDMSFTSKSGAYFVQKANSDGTFSIMCGYGITPTYNNSDDITEAVDAASKTKSALFAASSGPVTGSVKMTGSTTSNYSITPIFMLNFTAREVTDESGNTSISLLGFEFALGVEAYIRHNIPAMIGPIPVYVCVNLDAEVFAQMQVAFPDAMGMDEEMATVLLDSSAYATENGTEIQGMFAAPELAFGLKGGIGQNGFVSVFAEGTAHTPFLIDFTPWDGAGGIRFDIGLGADIILFTAEVEVSSKQYTFGNEELQDQLIELQETMTGATVTSTASVRTASQSYATTEEALDNMTFSVAQRPDAQAQVLRAGTMDSSTLASGVFKNTQIRLVRLDSGAIMALFLTDNHAPDGSLNYLSAAYTISTDNGKTWSQVEYVSENIGQATTSLQYDINVFELQDRILVTWSEADLDKVLAGVDLENITAAQIAKAVVAMNLRGRFFDKNTGEAMGEAFAIAENSTVFCGALDAVQNGDMVYVYYQRNALPTEEDVTVEDILSNERTIAMASANIVDTTAWTSVPIRAMSEEGQQYRITEVEPFVHDGILGEIIVLDRNGRLALADKDTGKLTADIEDRQLYLRTYDFDPETGMSVPTALTPLTDPDVCAQSPQVVSSEDYLFLLWNNNGEVVYTADFVARDTDNEVIRSGAYVIANADGTYTTQRPEETGGSAIDGDESFYIGTQFTASMADDGNVLVCWIGTDTEDTALIPTDEIYGMILESQAEEILSEDETITYIAYKLAAQGSPIALTDENRPIGALDSICMESSEESKFLLAYTRLNSNLRSESTAADILALTSMDAPELTAQVEVPAYPLPGQTVTAKLTVFNEGLEPLNGATVTVTGIGEDLKLTVEDAFLPGRSVEIPVEILIPQDFVASAVLDVTVAGLENQAGYTASAQTEVLYSSYIVPTGLELSPIPNSTDCLARVSVRNIGNASGTVSLDLINRVYGSAAAEDEKVYAVAFDTLITAGGEAVVSYVMEETLMDAEIYSTVQAWTGDNYDQGTEAPMPDPVTVTLDDIQLEDGEPTDPDGATDPEVPATPSDPDNPQTGDDSHIVLYSTIMLSALMCAAVLVFFPSKNKCCK